MKKKTMSMVGETKVESWFDGVAPASVKGATLLGFSNVGRLERTLYELKSGDFCSIKNGVGTVVRRRDFLKFTIDEVYLWDFSESQLRRTGKVYGKIKAEFYERGYEALKTACGGHQDGGAMGEFIDLFFKEATKTNPLDFNAADGCVMEAIIDKVKAMGLKGDKKCLKAARSLYGDFRQYVAKIAGNDQDNKVA